jgi:formylglycine-generating enzyme required for sulfatase activity
LTQVVEITSRGDSHGAFGVRCSGDGRPRTTGLRGRSVTGAESDAQRLPGELFRDCLDCSELVIVPLGEFEMGSTAKPSEQPVHHVSIGKNFAIGRRDVTFAEWDRCVAGSGCKFSRRTRGGGAEIAR